MTLGHVSAEVLGRVMAPLGPVSRRPGTIVTSHHSRTVQARSSETEPPATLLAAQCAKS
jgi:hypothetical protein